MHLLVPIVLGLGMVSSIQLPAGIRRCHYGEHECIASAINQLIRLYPKGVPELNIAPFDEFRPPDLQLYEIPQVGGIRVNIRLANRVFNGCENATVTHVTGFERDPTKSKMEIGLRIPRLLSRSTYDMQLRWLSMVQSNTTGPCQAEYHNVSLILNLKVFVKYKKQKRYLKVYKLTPQIDIGRMLAELGNQYAVNLDLTMVVNRIFNDNWHELWNEIEPKIKRSCSRAGAQMLNKIFQTIPYDDMFLQ